jgi:adenylate cyclase
MRETYPPEVADETRAIIRRAAIIANVVGSLVVFNVVGFLLPLVVETEERFRSGAINFAILLVFAPVSLYLSARYTGPYVAGLRAWLAAGADPTAAGHRRALRTPLVAARTSGVAWAVGAVLFGILNVFVLSPGVGIGIAIVIALGGLSTAALLYLIAERGARKLTAAALAAGMPNRPVAPGVRTRLLAAWALGTGLPLLAIVALAIGGWAGSRASIDELSQSVLFICLVALAVGLLATLAVARSIAEPVAVVRKAMARVERGDLEATVRVDDGSEVGLLEAGFNRMAHGLRERERLRDLFGRHVGRDVASQALEAEIELGGETREVAALFVDLTGSTRLAAERPPEEVVALLNSFFAVVVEAVERHGGLVNKFEGDAALAIFGAPVSSEDPAADALAAAREMGQRLREEVSGVEAGIGVSAGEAVAGNVGTVERYEYTVIGDPVNEAARLCDLAKARDERVLASEAAVTRAREEEAKRWRLGEAVQLRGRAAETTLAMPA